MAPSPAVMNRRWRRLSLMDYMAVVGGIINMLVIGFILGYWFMQ